MKKFLFHILVVALLLFIILFLITDWTDNGLRKTEFENFKEWNDIFSERISPDLIIQGTSRAWVQYNTQILDSTLSVNSYNMGMDGSSFDVQFLRFKACLAHNIVPKIIIQNVDWELLNKNIPPFQPYYFLPYLRESDFRKNINELKLLPKVDLRIPFLKYSGNLKVIQIGLFEYFNISHYKTNKYKGFKGVNREWSVENLQIRLKQQKKNFCVEKEMEDLFYEFLKICKEKEIQVKLVYVPPYHETNKLIDEKQITNYYKNLAKKNNIQFIDFSNDEISYSTKNYYNATHLNNVGAEIFTQKLSKKIGRQ